MTQDPGQIQDLLYSHITGFVATTAEDGSPRGAVVYYLPNQYGEVLFITKTETDKLTNIRSRPMVAFVVYDEDKQETLQLTGEAVEVKDAAEIDMFYRGLNRIAVDQTTPLPLEKLQHAGEHTIVKIIPNTSKYSNYSRS